MSYTEWSIKGPDFGSCNCAWGCPCQFNSPPINGDCRGVAAMHIEEGFFGDIKLDDLNGVSLYAWPGAVHEGGGKHQSIIDICACEEQRAAMLATKSGEHSVLGATVFDVFASVTEVNHEPIFATIEFDVDIARRTAWVNVPGLIESIGSPIRNPITGSEHQIKIALSEGFEFLEAECGSGTSKSSAAIALDFSDSYGQFSNIHLTPRGPVG